MIRIKNLNLFYKNKAFLQNINLNLSKNKTLGIIGESGAGKTLLFKSLIYFLDKNFKLSADEFSILNQNPTLLKGINLQKFRSTVSLVFQDAKASFHPLFNMGEIFDFHLKEKLNLSKKERKILAFKWLKRLNLHDCELIWHSFSHQLSTGMAMRVQLALSLANGAKILLCDEITNALDEQNKINLIQILRELKSEKTMILISHDLDFLKALSDEIIVLEKGKIVEQNANFFTKPKSKFGKEILEIYGEFNAFKGA